MADRLLSLLPASTPCSAWAPRSNSQLHHPWSRTPTKGVVLPPCRVTHTSEEYDHLRPPEDKAIYVEGYPVPHPELGPLERRVGVSFVDALKTDTINVDDMNYWFTPPPGGWEQEKQTVEYLEEVEVGDPIVGAHPGPDRIPITNFQVGDVIDGEVEAIMYINGALINFGADFDGLIPVNEEQWALPEVVEALQVWGKVKAKIVAVRDTEWFRFPVQLQILEPNIAHLLSPPEKHVAPLDLRDKPQDFELCLEKSGRPYRPTVYKDNPPDLDPSEFLDDDEEEIEEDEDDEGLGIAQLIWDSEYLQELTAQTALALN